MFSIMRKSEPMLDKYMMGVSETSTEPVDHRFKRYLIGEHETLTAARKRLLEERRFIEQQIAEHDKTIDAIGAALSSFETTDSIEDSIRNDAAEWIGGVDAIETSAYNDDGRLPEHGE